MTVVRKAQISKPVSPPLEGPREPTLRMSSSVHERADPEPLIVATSVVAPLPQLLVRAVIYRLVTGLVFG
jgi:hypothetical protein